MRIKKKLRTITILALFACFMAFAPDTAYALTDADVQTHVDSQSKEAVAGNVFIWFLCAIAFLKISQKIDSFMGSLGVSVGHTGGSMLAEAVIATRTLTGGKGIFGGAGKGWSSGGSGSSSNSGSSVNPLSGGLAGAIGRQINNSAAQSAVGGEGGVLGKKLFESSMEKGGEFANDVIGNVAKGNIAKDGSITGDTAVKALNSYLGLSGASSAAAEYNSGDSLNGALPSISDNSDFGAALSQDGETPQETSVHNEPLDALTPSGDGIPTFAELEAAGDSSMGRTGTSGDDAYSDTGVNSENGEALAPIGSSDTSIPYSPTTDTGSINGASQTLDGDSYPDTSFNGGYSEGASWTDGSIPYSHTNDAVSQTGSEAGSVTIESSSAAPSASIPASGSVASGSAASGDIGNISEGGSSVLSSDSFGSGGTSSGSSSSSEVSGADSGYIASTSWTQPSIPSYHGTDGGTIGGGVSSFEASSGLDTAQLNGISAATASETSIPTFSDVEIGGGRITGTETSSDYPEGVRFGLYNTEQYTRPGGDFSVVKTVDGAKWYKQYAVDTVEKRPYKAEDGKIAYNQRITKKMPPTPPRKERI